MSAESARLIRGGRIGVGRVLAGAGVVGVLDGTAAVLLRLAISGAFDPAGVFQGIASVVAGDEAVGGGFRTVALGLAMHFSVALAWTTVYATIYRYWPALREFTRSTGGAVLAGAAFGPLVWIVMRLAVLPLLVAQGAIKPGPFLRMIAIHIVCVGIPMAFIIRDRQDDPHAREPAR
ncbi:MAG: hypothetical protein ABJD11_14120 [Gemmatimonadota bacterium]